MASGSSLDNEDFAVIIKLHSDNPINAKDGLKDLIDNNLELASALVPGADAIISSLKINYTIDNDAIVVTVTSTYP